jgi:uncharacterized protein (DUF1800 family)
MSHRSVSHTFVARLRLDSFFVSLGLLGIGAGLAGCSSSTSSPVVSTQPQVTLAPGSLTFPSTTIGVAAAQQPISLSNPGTGALTLGNVTITGANAASFSQTNNCGASLAPGASCVVNVGFTPTTAGASAASISFTDNATGSPQIVAVTGTGTAITTPQITIGGASQVRLGSTAQLTATVTNETNTAVTWQVNGVTGGATATGTISATGLYTPPAILPASNSVNITAISVAAPTLTATAAEAVWNPLPAVTSAAVSQNYGATTGLLTVTGTGFVSGAQIQAGGTSVTTTFVSSTVLQATVPVASGATTVAVAVVNPNPGSATSSTANAQVGASLQSAARLLDQATFGPTLTDIQTVESEGLPAYLTAQFNTPTTIEPDIAATPPTLCATNTIPCQQAEWWQVAITGPDQLRQRVAFALSEMFVVSTNSVNARSVTTFQNMLANDAFANFLTIMHDVTLSPAMGAYLNMLNSAKPGVIGGVAQIANENYSRENMQLFTIGLDMLNQDGTLQLDSSGNPIPTYTEAQVQAFARVYTGWTYATASGGSPTNYPNNTANYDSPMAPVETQHDMLAKILLNGTTLPAGQTAEADLAGALTNIFNHPNVGPFVCRQLIQHLVTSNPSPAYVARVAAVFADDGTTGHIRGNMQAVVQAILLDTEARAGDSNPSFDGGHLREPMLYMTNAIRGLGFTFTGAGAGTGPEYYSTLSNYTSALSEKPYTSGAVFNFFPPNYVIPGTTTNAPEFDIENTASAVLRLTLADNIVYNRISDFTVDLSATGPLGIMASATGNATTDSTNLVNALSNIFMHGQMPAQMQTDIVNHVATLTNIPQRVRVATYLVLTSSFYKILH